MTTTTLFIGNAICLVGACLMVLTGLIKKKEHVLLTQCAQFGIMGVGNLVLGGVSGLISNLVSILRNVICLKFKFTIPLLEYTDCIVSSHNPSAILILISK